MRKKTKLTEKPTRIPDIRKTHWDKPIAKYLRQVKPLKSESARSHLFAMLVHELLGLEPGFIESYVAGIEKFLKVKQKDRILRGRVDNLFGNVVIEFEANILKKKAEAEGQLRRYVAILWSQEKPDARIPYLCIATDGVRFLTYSPKLGKPKAKEINSDVIDLQVLEETDWTKLKPEEVFFWLDRYFLRKEPLHPTSEAIVKDFGTKSHAFQTATNTLLALWQELKTQSTFAVIFDSWDKYLKIVYGSEVAGDELFIRHTYLATLAKLMAWMRISETKTLPDDEQILEMLEGELFKRQGVENFIEEDFFSWLARKGAQRIGVDIVRRLFSLLQSYHLRELSEDVLKSLYQELVDPATRHDLGEFYTPDWLAHRIVRKLLDENPQGSFLDPACGSGTFLYLAIREKIARLGRSRATLNHIRESVHGADVHPLAVIIAKTNYVLALGDLLKKRKKPIAVPIYLANTVKLPEYKGQTEVAQTLASGETVVLSPGYEVELDGATVRLPSKTLEEPGLYDLSVELVKEFARQNKGRRITITLDSFHNFLTAQRFPAANDETLVQNLFAIADALKHFIDKERDTIWAFVLKNIYKPLFFRRKFDFVVGNPPWIAYRYFEPGYQKFLKHQTTRTYHILKARGEHVPHLEIASLFLVHSADYYLKPKGTIAFVMPKSLFSADQHDGIRRRSFILSFDTGYGLFWREIWDCEGVEPLFNVPSCVLIADKREYTGMKYPVSGQILSGKLNRKNASLLEAETALTIDKVKISLQIQGKRSYWTTGKGGATVRTSYYKSRFAEGAIIVPRSFWFVQIKPSPLGFDPDLPPLETADRARKQAKPAYKSVFLKGTVESRFLYATLLSTDLLPFGHLGYRLVVLPIEPERDNFKLVDAEKARNHGYYHLAEWLETAEAEWTKRRTSKAEQISALGWLDYRKNLTSQNPRAKYRVLYPDVNRIMLASVTNPSERMVFRIGEQRVVTSNFLADCTTYALDTNSRLEALFLVATLNSRIVDSYLQPFRRKKQKQHPHVVKKVFDVAPIPLYDGGNPHHRELAELGKKCHDKVKKWIAAGGPGNIKSIGKLRAMVREMLKPELTEIDKLVETILK